MLSLLLLLLLLRRSLLCFLAHAIGAKHQSEEERLLDDFFTSYDKAARPVIDASKTVTVKIQFSLLHIQELVGE